MALLLYREMALLKTVFWQFSHAVGRGHGDRVMDQAEFTRLLTDIKLCVRRCAVRRTPPPYPSPTRMCTAPNRCDMAWCRFKPDLQGHPLSRSHQRAARGGRGSSSQRRRRSAAKQPGGSTGGDMTELGKVLRTRDVCQAMLMSQCEDEETADAVRRQLATASCAMQLCCFAHAPQQSLTTARECA